MNSTCRTAVAAAVAGGYVLGRTRKAKVAFAVGTFLAGRRFGLTPTALAAEGLRQLRESPQLAGLRDQIGGDLLAAARAAASTSADRRFAAFAETLRDRVKEDIADGGPEDDAGEEEDENEAEAEDEAEEEAEEEPEREAPRHGSGRERRNPPAQRAVDTARKRAAAGRPGPSKKSAAKKTAAKKTAAKKTAAKKTAAKKTAANRSRSTASRQGR
ncbi:hypothetical protein [Streptomyces sp. NPDC020983]|uniref:hypothetical protein n=1 Tax=Streptomyces sp. NPDC020983 TaxID=3365106 RepID=UPI0037BABAD6